MWIKSLSTISGLILMLMVTGCQSLGGQPAQVAIADGSYQLQHSWPREPVQLWQKVEWKKGEQQRIFMVSAVFDSERLLLVALSPFGNELFRSELSRANGITFRGSEAFDDSRLAIQVWSDLQMALWPLDSINANLTGMSLQVTQTGRELWHNGQLQWLSVNENENLQRTIENKFLGYQLTVTTLEYELLETNENHLK
ncbi:DUF3261 domain-containing protein [Idiomarina loihiensis]|uniref:DUF3261 domain-containing protein n=1 Tax=Idiomarina loihiensis TaxID=135577 RepID=UPI00129C828A|nr:DUF3261 domain-containing protein [Idiomarina loihiensis]